MHKIEITEQKTNGVRHWILKLKETGRLIGDFSTWRLINEKLEQYGDSRRIVHGKIEEIN